MSRKVLIVAVVLGLLAATLATPAMAAPSKADDVVTAEREARVDVSGSRLVLPLAPGLTARAVIWPNGGCESGGGGGCPVHS